MRCPRSRHAEHGPGAGQHPQRGATRDEPGSPDELIALQLGQQARRSLPGVSAAHTPEPALTPQGIGGAPDPVAAKLRVGVHDQYQIPAAQARQDTVECLIERARLPGGVADRRHDMRPVPGADLRCGVRAVVAHNDDLVWAASLGVKRPQRPADRRRLVMRRDDHDHPAVPLARRGRRGCPRHRCQQLQRLPRLRRGIGCARWPEQGPHGWFTAAHDGPSSVSAARSPGHGSVLHNGATRARPRRRGRVERHGRSRRFSQRDAAFPLPAAPAASCSLTALETGQPSPRCPGAAAGGGGMPAGPGAQSRAEGSWPGRRQPAGSPRPARRIAVLPGRHLTRRPAATPAGAVLAVFALARCADHDHP